MHLITVQGKSAPGLHIMPSYIEEFKSAVRALVSGCAFVVSTKFKTDILYLSEQTHLADVQKLWTFYTGTTFSEQTEASLKTYQTDNECLVAFFAALAALSYKLYQKRFQQAFISDRGNHIANTLINCDAHLLARQKPPCRRSLSEKLPQANALNFVDSSSLFMKYLNQDTKN